MNKRSKLTALIAALGGLAVFNGLAVSAHAQTAPPPAVFLYTFSNGRVGWPVLGPTFKITNGVVDVSLPQTATVTRKYDVVLVYDPVAAGWKVPAGATNVKAWVNGLNYSRDEYAISNAILKPVFGNMPADCKVIIDYDVVNP